MESGRSISGEEFDDVGVGFPGVGGFGGGGGGGGIDEGFIGDNSDSNYPTDDGAYSLCLNGTNLTLSSMYCNNTTGQAFPVSQNNKGPFLDFLFYSLFCFPFLHECTDFLRIHSTLFANSSSTHQDFYPHNTRHRTQRK